MENLETTMYDEIEDKAETLADRVELQCSNNYDNADLDHVQLSDRLRHT